MRIGWLRRVLIWFAWSPALAWGITDVQLPQPAYEPLPLPAKQPSQKPIFNNSMLVHNRRTLAGAYTDVGRRDPKWDDAMLAFMDGVAKAMSRQKDAPPRAEVLAQADRLLAMGCTEPLLLYARAFCLDEMDRPKEADADMRRALAEFEAKPVYPYSRMVLTPGTIARIHFEQGGTRNPEMDRLCNLTVQWWAESILRKEWQSDEQRLALYLIFLSHLLLQ